MRQREERKKATYSPLPLMGWISRDPSVSEKERERET